MGSGDVANIPLSRKSVNTDNHARFSQQVADPIFGPSRLTQNQFEGGQTPDEDRIYQSEDTPNSEQQRQEYGVEDYEERKMLETQR